MPNYSHSKLETFDQCKLKYKYRYIDKIPVEIETTIEAFMGSMVHDTLEFLYKQLQEKKLPTLKDLLEFHNQKWEDNYNNKILIVKNNPPDFYKDKGSKFLINYYYKHYPFDKSKTLALETQAFFPLGPSKNYHVRIDRLSIRPDKTIEVNDYKTNNRLKTQGEVNEDRQLAMYSLWVKNRFPNSKVKLIWHFLAFNQHLESTRTEEELHQLKLQVLKKIKEIESAQEFPANTGPLCNYCEFQDICSEFKKAI
jgi:putative RecB family exonuclease